MNSSADVVERLLRLVAARRTPEAFELLGDEVEIRRRDGSVHHGRGAAQRLREADAPLAARIEHMQLTLLLAEGERVAAGATVALKPESPDAAGEELEIAWSFAVARGLVVAVTEHPDMPSATLAAGIRSAKAPGVERRMLGWGVFARARAALAPRLLPGFAPALSRPSSG